MSEESTPVYWAEKEDGELVRKKQTVLTDYTPDNGGLQYRVVGKSMRGNIDNSSPTDLFLAKKKKEFWESTKYYRKVWIEKRVISPWEKTDE